MSVSKAKTNINLPHALFYDKLPSNYEDDITLAALAALNKEKTNEPLEYMLEYKNKGNEIFKNANNNRNQIKLAIKLYTKGIINTSFKELLYVEGQLYMNRAICYHKLQQYEESYNDVTSAIKRNYKNEKSYYYAALNCLHLQIYRKGIEACNIGMTYNDNTILFEKLVTELNNKLSQNNKACKIYQELSSAREQAIMEYFSSKNIVFDNMFEYQVPLAIPLIKNNAVHISFLCLFDELNRCEGIDLMNVNALIVDLYNKVFEIITEMGFDSYYNINNIKIYIESNSTNLIKLTNKEATIDDYLTNVDIIHKFCIIHINKAS